MGNQFIVIFSYPRNLVEKERRMKDAEPVGILSYPRTLAEKERRVEDMDLVYGHPVLPRNLVEKERRMKDADPVYKHLILS